MESEVPPDGSYCSHTRLPFLCEHPGDGLGGGGGSSNCKNELSKFSDISIPITHHFSMISPCLHHRGHPEQTSLSIDIGPSSWCQIPRTDSVPLTSDRSMCVELRQRQRSGGASVFLVIVITLHGGSCRKVAVD